MSEDERLDAVLRHAYDGLTAFVAARVDVDASLARLKGRAGTQQVFISYAHDVEGKRIAAALATELRARGVNVLWDRDLAVIKPNSVQSWMEEAFRECSILAVLSNSYVQAFELGNDQVRGARYEARSILRKLYHHATPSNCPVIPIASPEFDVTSVPVVLNSLAIHRFDPATGTGMDELVGRIGQLQPEAVGATMRPIRQESLRTLRTVLRELESVDPSSGRARKLVHELIDVGDGHVELAGAFDLAETTVRAHGDVNLMRRLSESCVRVLETTQHRTRESSLLEAKILISGRAWYLLREHRLAEAGMATERGIQLAKRFRDSHTAALGMLCHARVHVRRAEGASRQDAEYHLRKSQQLLMRATNRLQVAAGQISEEFGECIALSVEWHLARYVLFGDLDDLTIAQAEAERAGAVLMPNSSTYRSLTVLRARLCLACREYDDGWTLVTSVIDAQGPRYSEILGWAHRARAELSLARGEAAGAVRDMREAEDIFRNLGHDYAAAMCWWVVTRRYPAAVRGIPFTYRDVVALEELTSDPRIRHRAVQELELRTEKRLLPEQLSAERRDEDWASMLS